MARTRSICSRCGERRRSIEQPWYRVAMSGKGGNPGMGAYLGTVAQFCACCWYQMRQNDSVRLEYAPKTSLERK